MYHCNGGIGANAFGGQGQRAPGTPPLSVDPKHDGKLFWARGGQQLDLCALAVLAAMVDWVENGKAPTDIIAAKYSNNNATQGVQFTRKLCPVSVSCFR